MCRLWLKIKVDVPNVGPGRSCMRIFRTDNAINLAKEIFTRLTLRLEDIFKATNYPYA